MNTEPKKTQPTPQKKRVSLPAFVLRNWPWRLLALFLAICLWAGLISQDPTLTRERVFNDVPISVNNADILRRNSGLVVVAGLEPENLSARLLVEVPQREYTNVTGSSYNPRVDLSRINAVGEQELRVYTTSTTTYGSVEDVSPSTLTVTVDEYVTNYRVPVYVNITGEYPEGFYGAPPSLDPSVVAVSGPKTLVDQVARVVVDFDVSRLSARAGEVRTARAMRFVDRNGNDVDSSMLEATSADVVLRTIIVEQTLYPLREIPLNAPSMVTGSPAKGYRIKEINVTPSSILAAGEEESLALVNELFASAPLNVEGDDESITQLMRVRKPSEIKYLSADTVTVRVEIEPTILSRTFDSARLSLRGMGSTQSISMDHASVSMVLSGPELLVDNLRSAEVTAYLDVSSLNPGEYDLPVQLHIEGVDVSGLTWQATPSTVHVIVNEK